MSVYPIATIIRLETFLSDPPVANLSRTCRNLSQTYTSSPQELILRLRV